MKRAFLLFAWLLCAATIRGQPVAPGDMLIVSSSWPSNQGLVAGLWRVSLDRLRKQPIWDPLKEDPPPLLPSAATKIAITQIQKDFPDIKQWKVSQILLRNIDKGEYEYRGQPPKHVFPNRWYYFVCVEPTDQAQAEAMKSKPAHFCAVILMDGSVVIPEISDAAIIQSK